MRETQLFNLAENPDEYLAEQKGLTSADPKPGQVNLAEDPRYVDKRKEMEALLLSEMRRLNDPYRLWDQPEE